MACGDWEDDVSAALESLLIVASFVSSGFAEEANKWCRQAMGDLVAVPVPKKILGCRTEEQLKVTEETDIYVLWNMQVRTCELKPMTWTQQE